MVQLVIEGVDLSTFVDDVIATVKTSRMSGTSALSIAQQRVDELNRIRVTPLSPRQKNAVARIAVRQAALAEPDRAALDVHLVPTPQGGFMVPRSEWNWAGQPLPPEAAAAGASARGRMSASSGEQAWRGLEHTVAKIMGGTVRSGSHDGGIDVESGRAVAQVKRQRRSVGAPVVQQLHGAAQGEGKDGEFYTTSSYSRDAIAFARRAGVKLFVVDEVTGQAHRVE